MRGRLPCPASFFSASAACCFFWSTPFGRPPSRPLARAACNPACVRADFLFLQRLTGLTKGNLSNHLLKLEETELVGIDKRFRGKIPTTLVALTPAGRAAIEEHCQQLERLRQDVRTWGPADGRDGDA